MIEIITTENKSLGKFKLKYDTGEFVLHGDHYIRIPQKLYQQLFYMDLHGLPKYTYIEKEEDYIEHDGHYIKYFFVVD